MPDPDPHWVIQQTPQAKIALVYVHGVTGDIIGTWTAENGQKFWDLVNENEHLKGKADAFVYGFPSYLYKSSFDIQQAANALHQRLEFNQVFKYPAVVFVAHSMGGLVVLRELLTHQELLDRVPVVMLYATPMEGSAIAAIGKAFSPNSAFAQMTEADGNAMLKTLNDEWKSLPDNKRPHVRCAYENKPIGPFKVVGWASATRFCEGAAPAIDATHITIVKPDRPNADAIIDLANALETYAFPKIASDTVDPDGEMRARIRNQKLRTDLVDEMSNVANDLYLSLQVYSRRIEDPHLPTRIRNSLRNDLDAEYRTSVAGAKRIEMRLGRIFAKDEPRRFWHAARDILQVRYFQLIGRATDRLIAANASDENPSEWHSGLTKTELRGLLRDPENLMKEYRDRLDKAIQEVLRDPVVPGAENASLVNGND